MIQNLADRIWQSADFHTTAENIEHAWLKREIGAEELALAPDDVGKLIRAAAILACSENQEHRKAAYRAATCCYDLSDPTKLPFDQALRVILTRLGNFPSLGTRKGIEEAVV